MIMFQNNDKVLEKDSKQIYVDNKSDLSKLRQTSTDSLNRHSKFRHTTVTGLPTDYSTNDPYGAGLAFLKHQN
jgi:hypothetical protein